MADLDKEHFGGAAARKELRRRFERARNSYDQTLNRLWAGNSAGALAAIAALGPSEEVGLRLSFQNAIAPNVCHRNACGLYLAVRGL
jgi:hypothetical protein